MPEKNHSTTENTNASQFLATGARVWNQFMMFIVLVGALPILFPRWIEIKNTPVVLFILATIFATSVFSEIWRSRLMRQKKDVTMVANFQLLTRAILLTGFLHFFGRINGPFFILYLLVVMESFLNGNLLISNAIVGLMVFSTMAEFVWLVLREEVILGFVPLVGLTIRVISIVFMHAYGSLLAEKIGFEKVLVKKVIGREPKTKEEVDELARQLKKVNVKLKELSALKDEFVSVASHELRAPMTTIKGYISMILEGDAGKIPPKVKEFLGDAYESNDRMIRLVNNMLNVSRIESGRLIMSLKDIQIEEVIGEVVKDFHLEAESHGLELKFFKPKKRLARVRVDPDRIREVIANLVGNAINFTPHGHVHIRAYEEDGMVTVAVEDTGVGIASADQKQLFKKFSQIGVGAPLKKGSGLGLYICKMLINEFGGEIRVKSKVGRGTTFYFSLPAIVTRFKKR